MARQASEEFMNPNYKEVSEEPNKDEAVVSDSEPKVDTPLEESSSQDSSQKEPEDITLPASILDNPIAEAAPEELTPEAKNFRTLRELKKKAEKERDEVQRQYNEMVARISAQTPSKESPEDDDFNINPDDLIEGKHLKKIVNEVKQVKQQLNQYKSQSELLKTEVKLKKRFADFDEVVTKENLEILVAREPELAQGLDANPDLYSKAITAYTMIKNLDIYIPSSEKKKIANFVKDSKKIDENLSRPQVAASISPQSGSSPLSKASQYADDLTQDELNRVYAEMVRKANG